MDFRLWWFMLVFIISFLFVAIVIPAIVRTANRMNLFDSLDDRKVHTGKVPRLGGISFLPSLMFSLLLVISVMSLYFPMDLHLQYGPITEVMLALAGCVLLFLTGIVDDVIGVTYKIKFIVQIISAGLMCSSGLWISDLHGIFGIHELPMYVAIPLTIIIIVLIINSINLIDGIDGLASGLSILGTAGYSIVFFYKGMNIYLLLSAAMLGCLVMFYLYNTLGKPGKTKIFMGDTGSLTMGFLLAFFAIKVTSLQSSSSENSGFYLIYAVSVLLIPVMDVFRVFFARIRDGIGPFYPDRRHIHHKFLALSFSMRQARYIIFSISLLFLAMNIFLSIVLHVNINVLILINAVIWIALNMLVSRTVLKLKERHDPVAESFVDLGRRLVQNRKRRRN